MMKERTIIGKLSILCGIIALTLLFSDLFIMRGVINWIIPTIMAIMAIFLGDSVAEKGDKLGTIAMILGGVYLLIFIVALIAGYYYLISLFS